MHYEINKITIEEHFKVCPTCGYHDGFHSMLKKDAIGMKLLFICPACHDVFDVGVDLDNLGLGMKKC